MSKLDLAPMVGRSVQCKGEFAGSRQHVNPEKSGSARINKVATFQRIYTEIEGESVYIGHAHVQYASEILRAKARIGDQLSFVAEVYEYMKKFQDGTQTILAFGLSNPSEVEICEPVRPSVTTLSAPTSQLLTPTTTLALPTTAPFMAPIPQTAPSTASILRKIKALGPDTIKQVLQLQSELGTAEFQEIVNLLS